MQEIWVPIKKDPFSKYYEVSNFGRVRRNPKYPSHNKRNAEGILKQQTGKQGYKVVTLKVDELKWTVKISRLVALHFLPNENTLLEVNHIDGIKANNHIENLEWVTPKENMAHAYKNKLVPIGENHPHARLKNSDIPIIRKMLSDKVSYAKIASYFSVSPQSIYQIKYGKSYKHF